MTRNGRPADDPTGAAVAWLLASDEPAVRHLTRRDLLGEAAAADAARVLEGGIASALLAGQRPDGGFGVRPYSKWTGAHWRLVSLVELAAPAGEPRLQAAASTVLDWLTGEPHRRTVQVIDGLARRCASQEGNALAVACRLGMAGDPRADLLARSLAGWQWPDGGVELRPAGQRPPLVVPRVAPTGLGPARVLAGHRRGLGPGGSRAGGRAVPLPPAVPAPSATAR